MQLRGARIAETSADADGEFVFTRIAPGRYRVSGSSGRPVEVIVPERGDPEPVEIRQCATSNLLVRSKRGIVIDRCRVFDSFGDDTWLGVTEEPTVASLHDLSIGTYELQAFLKDGTTQRLTIEIRERNETQVELP